VDSEGNLYVAGAYTHTVRIACRPVAIDSSAGGIGFSNGQFICSLTGPAGQAIILDSSTDLVNWVPVWTNTFMVGPLSFADQHGAMSSQRFYRAHRR
jgi:hypothetical protein